MIVIAPSVNEPNVIKPLTSAVADSKPADAIKFVALTLLLNAPVVAPLNAPLLNVAVPSVNDPPVIAPDAVIVVAPEIEPPEPVPTITLSALTLPLAVTLVNEISLSKFTVSVSVSYTHLTLPTN